MARWAVLASSAIVLCLVAGCRGAADESVIHVAAAASLADVLPPLAERFEQSHHVEVELRFGASSTLARQIREGAPTDALVSADPRWVDDVISARLADRDARVVIATNRLVAIVPADAQPIPRDARALAALPHIAVAGREVPAGAHARTALERSGVLALASPRIVEAPDVRFALAWVASGEAEAGIVYATDARAEPRVRVAFEFASATHDPIRYEAAAIARAEGAPVSEAGRAWVAFLASDAARTALAEAGFGAP